MFTTKDDAILHRRFLELLLDSVESNKITVDEFNKYSIYNNNSKIVQESLKHNIVVLYCE